MLGAPGRISSRFAPMEVMRFTTSCLAPSPTASIVTTDATPMMMPSNVSKVRIKLRRSACPAIAAAATTSRTDNGRAPPRMGRIGGAGVSAAGWLVG